MSRRLLAAWFGGEQDILGATRAAREAGYEVLDVHTPYAVHGLDTAAGLKPSRLPWICFALGLTGAAAKLWYQIWTSATSWPVNVGGKPLNSVPAFVPVTFEMMVLFAAVGTVLAFFVVSRLRPGARPRHVYERTTNDLFALVLVQGDSRFDAAEVGRLLGRFNLLRMEERLDLPDGAPAAGAPAWKPAAAWVLAGVVAATVALTYLLPRTFTERNFEFLPGMVGSVPYDALSANPNFPDGKTMRMPVAGTIARGHLPFDSSRADAAASKVLASLAAMTPDELGVRAAKSAAAFATFCQPCHGPAGKGDGTVPAHGYPAPPPLDGAAAMKLTDGQMFNIITFGKGNMPSLAHRIPAEERWLAVSHIRHLQSTSVPPQQPSVPDAGAPTAKEGGR